MDLWHPENEAGRFEKIAQTRAYYLPLAEKHTFLIHELEELLSTP